MRARSSLWLVSLVMLCAFASARAWETVVEEPGLKVEQRFYAGSPLMEIRGTTYLQASLGAIVTLLRDDDYNDRWVYRSGGARILSEQGHEQAYVYGVVDAPWPIADRDTVVRFDYRQAPDTGVISIDITNFPDFAPREPGLIRVPEFGGFWRLTPEKDGRVEVIYQVHGDPGGWVPTWLANRAAVLSVTRTLQNMPLAVSRYRGATPDYVWEVDSLH